MTQIRLGAVAYLNARPLVYGLERSPLVKLRFDVPSKCAELLHAGAIDVGMIPSIEYLRGGTGYRVVPDLAIASRGPVASVLLFTSKPIDEVRSIAMDTSSRTSVALVKVLCTRHFRIAPALRPFGPDLKAMLADCDAALVIGDNALFADVGGGSVETIDLGQAWTDMTGLPFVWAFWAGRPGAIGADHVQALREARDEGVTRPREIAEAYSPDEPGRWDRSASYLRDNIKYELGRDERSAVDLFFRYAAEAGVIENAGALSFY
jgi:chorismate dehydratase